MNEASAFLLLTAASVAFLHTLLGPDHYLPFVGMARAFHWSRRKLTAITLLCGLGHVLSSVALGLVGIALGWSLSWMHAFESTRGRWAAYGLIAFGLVYGIWGLVRARRGHSHSHAHVHVDGSAHEHVHDHRSGHLHIHQNGFAGKPASAAIWMVFSVFLLGPCEPMIPLLMYPAAQRNWRAVAAVAVLFSLITLVTMTAAVLLGEAGIRRLQFPRIERYAHALAGGVIVACGLAVTLIGL